MSPALVAGGAVAALAVGGGAGLALTLAIGRFGPDESDPEHRPHSRHLATVPPVAAIGFLLAFLRFGLSWDLLVAAFVILVMAAIAFIDLDHMIIPNVIVLPAAVVGLAASVALDPRRWWVFLVAAVGSALFLFVLALIWPGGMGMGDVKLALFMGGVLGPVVIVAFFLAFFLGAIVGLALIATKRKTRKDAIPFGPYLALGSVLALLYGPWLLHTYIGALK